MAWLAKLCPVLRNHYVTALEVQKIQDDWGYHNAKRFIGLSMGAMQIILSFDRGVGRLIL